MVEIHELRSCPNCGSFNIEDEANLQTHCYDCKEDFPSISTDFPLVEVVKLSDLEPFGKSFIKTLDNYAHELNDDSINKFKNNDVKSGNLFAVGDIKLLFKKELKQKLGLGSEKEKEIVDSRLNQSVSQSEKSKVSDNPEDWIDTEILLKSHETLMKYIDEARDIEEIIKFSKVYHRINYDKLNKKSKYHLQYYYDFVDKIAKEEKI